MSEKGGELIGLEPKDDENWTIEVVETMEGFNGDDFVSCASALPLNLMLGFFITQHNSIWYSLFNCYHIFQKVGNSSDHHGHRFLGIDPKDGENRPLVVAGTKDNLYEDGFVSCRCISP
jgi:hypothetical protein